MPDQHPAPKPPISPERLAANRANAKKSTGPKTPEGKARSRANALQHGLAAQVVPTPELETAFHQKAEAYEAILQPANDLERDLVHTAALGASRMAHARHREFAAARTRLARAEYDAQAALDAALARLPDDPSDALRELTSTTAGIDRLLAAWTNLRAPIADGRWWNDDQRDLALNLLGLPALAAWTPAGRPIALACFALSNRCPIGLHLNAQSADRVHGTHGLCVQGAERIPLQAPTREQARATVLALIDTHRARLSALRDALAPIEATTPAPTLDPADRLWQRYETAARSTWNAALARLRTLQTDRRRAEDRDEPPPPARPRNEPTPFPHPQSLAAMTHGMDPAPMIAALRERLRAMARAAAPNEPKPGDEEAPPRNEPKGPSAAKGPGWHALRSAEGRVRRPKPALKACRPKTTGPMGHTGPKKSRNEKAPPRNEAKPRNEGASPRNAQAAPGTGPVPVTPSLIRADQDP